MTAQDRTPWGTADREIPVRMRAVILDGPGFDHVRIADVAVPRPGPGQILARVDAAGICTSLLKLIDQGQAHNLMSGWDITRYPAILGDEGCVTLVEVGEKLRERFPLGQRCVVQPAVDHPPINVRERYRNDGRGVYKLAAGYTLPGHLAEYMLIQEEVLAAGCLLPIPQAGMPYAHAAITEPLSCIVSSQDRHVHLLQENPLAERRAIKGLKPGGLTLITGAGPMGRMHVDLALSYRPRTLIVADHHDEKLALVQNQFGARAARLGVRLVTVNTGKADLQAVVDEESDLHGADDVIVSAGTRQAIEDAQRYVGRGGVLNLFAGLKKGDDMVSLDSSLIHYKEINVTGSSGGSPYDIAHTLDLIADGQIDPARHIAHIGGLEHAAGFMRMIKDKQTAGKAVVYPHRPATETLSVRAWTAEDERAYLTGNRP